MGHQLAGEDAEAFSKDSENFMLDGNIGMPSSTPSAASQPEKTEDDDVAPTPVKAKKGNGNVKGKDGVDTPDKTKEQKHEESRKRKLVKEAALPEKKRLMTSWPSS